MIEIMVGRLVHIGNMIKALHLANVKNLIRYILSTMRLHCKKSSSINISKYL